MQCWAEHCAVESSPDRRFASSRAPGRRPTGSRVTTLDASPLLGRLQRRDGLTVDCLAQEMGQRRALLGAECTEDLVFTKSMACATLDPTEPCVTDSNRLVTTMNDVLSPRGVPTDWSPKCLRASPRFSLRENPPSRPVSPNDGPSRSPYRRCDFGHASSTNGESDTT